MEREREGGGKEGASHIFLLRSFNGRRFTDLFTRDLLGCTARLHVNQIVFRLKEEIPSSE